MPVAASVAKARSGRPAAAPGPDAGEEAVLSAAGRCADEPCVVAAEFASTAGNGPDAEAAGAGAAGRRCNQRAGDAYIDN